MNPSAILKLMSAKAAFTKNHPKFSAFCKAALSRPIEPGTRIDDGEHQSAAGGSGSSGKPERTFGVKLEVGGKG